MFTVKLDWLVMLHVFKIVAPLENKVDSLYSRHIAIRSLIVETMIHWILDLICACGIILNVSMYREDIFMLAILRYPFLRLNYTT